MMRVRIAVISFATLLACGCSALVAGTLDDKGPGPGGDGGTTACMGPTDCPDDMDPCNGTPTCVGGRCMPGMALRDGMECGMSPRRICLAGTCGPSRCGDMFVDGMLMPPEACDDGNMNPDDGCTNDCQFSCTDPADCDNAFACDGRELCSTTTHRCSAGALPAPGTTCLIRSDIDGQCMVGPSGALLCCANDGTECCDAMGTCGAGM